MTGSRSGHRDWRGIGLRGRAEANRRFRPLAVAAVIVGGVLTTVSIIAIHRSSVVASVGGATADALAVAPPTVTGPAVAGRPATLPAATPAIAPARITAAEVGLMATVHPVGIDPATGDVDIPHRVDAVGWYRFGPGLEATSGSIVIAGHVDLAGHGPGAFFRLRDLEPGDLIEVTGTDGASRHFRVVAREEWPKSRLPVDRVFGRVGAVRLTLVSCAGPFDRTARSYRRNIVITAVPA